MSYTVIVGGNSGIGKGLIEDLSKYNKKIILIDNVIQNVPDKNIYPIKLDLREISPSIIENEINEILKNEKIDNFIYCAGIREICNFQSLELSKWNEIFNVNVTSFFILAKIISNKMAEGSSIVSISSVSGVLAEPNRMAYVSSKHALIGLSKCLAIELASKGIRVNSVAPGVIRTPLTEEYFNDPILIDKINKNHILKRTGEINEVVDAISFLISKKSSFMTGTTLYVDGGWTAFKDI